MSTPSRLKRRLVRSHYIDESETISPDFAILLSFTITDRKKVNEAATLIGRRKRDERRRGQEGGGEDEQGGKGVSLLFRLAFIRFKAPPV